MKDIKKLGEKCTSAICCEGCPIYYFNEYGAGKDSINCMGALRFPTVAQAVKLWIDGKEWNKKSLMSFGRNYDKSEFCTYHELECDYKGDCIDCPHNSKEDVEWFEPREE